MVVSERVLEGMVMAVIMKMVMMATVVGAAKP